jgi:protein involved in polysaccharide export with SLBB domain
MQGNDSGNATNGTWRLYAVNDVVGDIGQFAGGWTLEITAEADVQVRKRVKGKTKHKQKGKDRR